jgi:hypothetical protein
VDDVRLAAALTNRHGHAAARLLSFAVYLAIFGSIAWARFTSADIAS